MKNILPILLFLLPSVLFAQELTLEKATENLTATDSELRMKAHGFIGKQLIYTRPDSALFHFNSSIGIAKERKDLLSEQTNTVALGVAYQVMGLLDTSEAVLKRAMELIPSLSDSMNFGIIHNNLAITLAKLGRHTEAITLLHTAAKYYGRTAEFQRQADANMSIGNSYKVMGYFDLAMQHINDAVLLCQKNDIPVNGQLWNALGLIYQDQKKRTEAANAYRNGLDAALQEKNSYGIALLSDNLSRVLTELGRTDSAFILLDTAWHHASMGQMKGLMIQIHRSKAMAYQKEKKYAEARAAILEALAVDKDGMPTDTKAWLLKNMAEYQLEDDNVPLEEGEATLKQLAELGMDSLPLTLQGEYHRISSSLLSFQGKHEQAFAEYRAYHALNDQLWNVEKSNRISELQIQFETQQKDDQIALLQTEQQLTTSRIRNQRIAMMGMAGGGLLLLGLGISGFLLFRQRKRNETLAHSIAARDAERNRLARELHDGVAGELFGLQMAVQGNKPIDMRNELGRLRDEIRHISHDLAMPDIQKTSLPEMADYLIGRHRHTGREVVLMVQPPDDAKWTLPPDKAQHIYRMLQEGLGNALRHTATEDLIKVRLNRTATEVNISIENPNGKTVEPSNGNGNGNGIGLKNLHERAELIGGKIEMIMTDGHAILMMMIPINRQEHG